MNAIRGAGDFQRAVREVKSGRASVADATPRMLAFIAALDEPGDLRECKAQAAAVHQYLLLRRGSAGECNAALKIKARVEHRLGQVLSATVNHRGSRGQLRGITMIPQTPTLPDKIDKLQSSRAQRLAAVAWRNVEAAIDAKTAAEERASLAGIVRDLTRPPRPTHTPDLPVATYRCLVIDPPWSMARSERSPRPDQDGRLDYATMPLEEIEALPVSRLADPDGCHVYLWVTHRFLPDGLRLLGAWGLNYHCLLTWVKPSGMTPYSWMFNTEHVLFAYRGKFSAGRPGLKVAFEAPAPRGAHSTKPPVFYDRVRQFSPAPRLAMFARKEEEGFDVWGNEV